MSVTDTAQTLRQGVLQIPDPLLPENSGPVHGGGPSYEYAPNNAVATPSSFQGGSNASTSNALPMLVSVLHI